MIETATESVWLPSHSLWHWGEPLGAAVFPNSVHFCVVSLHFTFVIVLEFLKKDMLLI